MTFSYRTSGTCARAITVSVENDIITDVEFMGGCNGNLKAISRLVDGKKAEEISAILAGNPCGMKNTSCADQLSKAINEALQDA